MDNLDLAVASILDQNQKRYAVIRSVTTAAFKYPINSYWMDFATRIIQALNDMTTFSRSEFTVIPYCLDQVIVHGERVSRSTGGTVQSHHVVTMVSCAITMRTFQACYLFSMAFPENISSSNLAGFAAEAADQAWSYFWWIRELSDPGLSEDEKIEMLRTGLSKFKFVSPLFEDNDDDQAYDNQELQQ